MLNPEKDQQDSLNQRIRELEAEILTLKTDFFRPSREATVMAPEPMKTLFNRAQTMIREFFRGARSDPSEGTIEIDGDRYILVRASALSTNYIDAIVRVYADRSREEAEAIGRSLLFDLAHTIGLNDARNIHRKMGLTDPIEKLSAGPVHFAYAGWAFVDIRPESNPVPSEDFVIIYDHPYSFEAHTWLAEGRKSEYPVCVMNAGYSSGWCEESFGIPLTAVEVTCRAKGDAKCTFLMAPPHRIVERVREYFGINIKDQIRKGLSIPAYFERKVAEDQLRDSERMFRAVVDQTYQFIGLLKTDGTLIDVNETALAFSGIVKSDVMNKPFWEGPWWTHSPELQDKVRDAVKRTAAGDFVRFEATHPAKDGSMHYVDFSMKPVRDEEGKIIMLLPEGRDITDRKSMEEALRAERDKAQRYLNIAGVITVVLNPDQTVALINKKGCDILGWSESELVGANWFDKIVPTDERDTVKATFRKLMAGDVTPVEHYENSILTKNGDTRMIAWYNTILKDEKGRIIGTLSSGEDITERKKTEAALKDSEERFSQIVNRAVVGVFRTALDGMALLANPAVMKMFDFDSVESFNAAGGVTNFYQSLDDRQRLFAALMQGPVTAMEIPFHRRDRSVMILSLSAKLVRDDKGNPVYIEGTLEDISERKKVEQALRESEERFSQIVNRAVVGVFRTSMDGKALLANPAVLRVFGFDTIEAFNTGGGVTPLYQNLDDRLRLLTALMKGPVYGIEIPFYRRDRTGMILSLSVNLERDEKGNPLYIEGTMEDITARKKAEQALRESEERFTQVVNRAIVGVFRTDLNGMALLANPAVLSIFGYDTIEAFNADGGVTHLYKNAEDRQRLIAGLMKGTVSGMEMPFYRRDGSNMFLSVSANLMRDEKGNPQFLEGTLEDITNRKKAEQALRESEEKYRILFDSAGDAIYIHSPAGKMLAVNQVACDLLGYTREEIMSMSPQSVDTPDESVNVAERVATLMEKGRIVFETTHRHKNGSLVPTEVNAQRITFNDEPAVMAICRDITERRQAEQQLQHTMDELKRSNRELEEFASVASHDLQEPLRKILTFSDRIRTKTSDNLDPESMDYLSRMQSAASRMQTLINDLLSYSRVTTQAKPFVPVDLGELTRDVLVDLELRIRPGLDRVDIADLPTISADPGQIRQLLYNLLSNALKFRRADQPALIKVEGGIDNGRCLIRVRDNGIGFDEKYRESIFGIFKRLHSRSEYEGTGVGLAICKKIAERHGGNITASSTPGEGATFEVVLPVRH